MCTRICIFIKGLVREKMLPSGHKPVCANEPILQKKRRKNARHIRTHARLLLPVAGHHCCTVKSPLSYTRKTDSRQIPDTCWKSLGNLEHSTRIKMLTRLAFNKSFRRCCLGRGAARPRRGSWK